MNEEGEKGPPNTPRDFTPPFRGEHVGGREEGKDTFSGRVGN